MTKINDIKFNCLFVGLTVMLILTGGIAGAGTKAYWRFEEGPLGANVDRGGQADGIYYPGTLDSSGNSYDLSAWTAGGWAGEAYRSNVPAGQVPQTGVVNRFSLQNTGNNPGLWNEDAGLSGWAPETWTVEAWVYCTSVNNWRVAVGRDGDDIGGREDPTFRIMFTNANAVRMSFFDMAGNYYELNTVDGYVEGNRWYHLAGVSDGSTVSLYVDGTEAASDSLEPTDPRMSNGSNGRAGGGDWAPGNWTVFRGMWNGEHKDRWYGCIDEVRISDTALSPAEFLNNGGVLEGPDDRAVYPGGATSAAFTVTAVQRPAGTTLADVDWYIDVPGPDRLLVEDGVKYAVTTTADGSTLTIHDVTQADLGDYYAVGTFSDASMVISTGSGRLFIRSGLVHRYGFDGDVTDSVGAADGTVVDPTGLVSFADGQLRLDNPDVTASPDTVDAVSYVELPAGIISSLDNYMTIEMWLTPHRNSNWTTFFAFGDTFNADPFTDGFNGGRVGILGQLNRDQNGARGPSFTSVAPGGSGLNLTASTPVTLDEEFMYAVTWDGNTKQMSHYVNGVLIDTDTVNLKLSDIEDVKCWLGLPLWPDPVLNASINELRIYDSPLSDAAIDDHYVLGPDALEHVAGAAITPADLVLAEEGATAGDLQAVLEYPPADAVTLTFAELHGRGQVTLDRQALTFTTANWNVPQAIRVTAVEDAVLENAEQPVLLAVTASSADANYDGLAIEPVVVTVLDNECGAWGYASSDFNLDCVIDISDLARFAQGWLGCSDPDGIGCADYRVN